jgi:hypothetical protein
MLTTMTVLSVSLTLGGPLDPAEAPSVLPPPQPMLPLVAAFRPECWRRPPPPESTGTLGIDRFGHLRPLIIAAPYGHAYYAANGAPYPFLPVRTAP